MKFAYKVIKNKKNVRAEEAQTSDKVVATINPTVVSFILVAKVILGFRECAKIVKIAKDTGCTFEIASGTKAGTSESILSLVALEITADKSLVLTIKGTNTEEAFRGISKIISGEVES